MPDSIPAKRKLPIGISDFRMPREENRHCVDKTHFIREIIVASARVPLLPRPRRFGKTLNLSMPRYFFEKSDADLRPIFRGLSIADDPVFDAYFGEYPVIHLTFKELKSLRRFDCFEGIQRMIAWEILRHRDREGNRPGIQEGQRTPEGNPGNGPGGRPGPDGPPPIRRSAGFVGRDRYPEADHHFQGQGGVGAGGMNVFANVKYGGSR